MSRRSHALRIACLLPLLAGFDASRPREELDRAYHNLLAPDVLAGVELGHDV